MCNEINKVRVSVIIPIYNVEKYLDRSINSILNQTLKDIEIILVDDGSSDKSGDICDSYAEKDSRIKVIHKQNAGVSAARNDGILVAKGEYIGFVDADDYVDIRMFETLYKAASNSSSEIAACEFDFVENDAQAHFHEVNTDNIKYSVLDCKEAFNLFVDFDTKVQTNIWNKIFKSEIIKDYLFDTDKKMSEDLEVLMKILCNCKNVAYLPYNMYAYIYIREGSAMYSVGKSTDWYMLQDKYITDTMEYVKNKMPSLAREANAYRCVNGELSLANAIVRNNDYKKSYISYIKERFKSDFTDIIKSNLSIIKKSQIIIFMISPKLYGMFMKHK